MASQLSYDRFCAAFDEELLGPTPGETPSEQNIRFADDKGATSQEVEDRLRAHVTKNFDNLRKVNWFLFHFHSCITLYYNFLCFLL